VAKYQLKRRAERMEGTRRRIARATAELHGILGPARTTISAIAERAGVDRVTVYRHFPDDLSLYRACLHHLREAHPWPDPVPWQAIGDPRERLRVALREIYAYYRSVEPVWEKGLPDLARLPALQEADAPMFEHWATFPVVLDRGWSARGRRREHLRAYLGHALEFPTWQSFVRGQGLTDEAVVELLAGLASCLDDRPNR
jgi:AcrR family transcriptional regulator